MPINSRMQLRTSRTTLPALFVKSEPQLCEKVVENRVTRIHATKRSRGGHYERHCFPYDNIIECTFT